eukprot:4904270-Alexandrium_andersonii.AAC.1
MVKALPGATRAAAAQAQNTDTSPQADLQEDYEEVRMKPPGRDAHDRQAADAARALAVTSAAASQGQQATESILLQGQPLTAEPQTAPSSAASTSPAEAQGAATLQTGPQVVLQPGTPAPTGARSQLGP